MKISLISPEKYVPRFKNIAEQEAPTLRVRDFRYTPTGSKGDVNDPEVSGKMKISKGSPREIHRLTMCSVVQACLMASRRYSKIIVLLSVSMVLWAQDEPISIQFNGDLKSFDVSSEKDLSEQLKSIQSHYEKEGFLNMSLVCTNIERLNDNSGKISAYWDIVNISSPAIIDSILIDGIDEINFTSLNKFFHPILHQVASNETMAKVEKIVDFYPYLKRRALPYYVTYKEEKVAIILPLESNFRSNFSGAFGYAPGAKMEPQLTGEIMIHLENLFGTASVAELWWQRKDELSQILSLSYEEPFIWRFNIGAGFTFYQNLQDGLYVRRRTRITGIKPFSLWGKWYAGGERISVTVTPEGDSLGLSDHEINSLIVENVWERRNSLWNPTKGFYIKWTLEIGNYSGGSISKAILYRGQTELEIVKPIRKRLNFTLHGLGGYVGLSRNQNVPISEQFLIGGASTLRGYREQVFQLNWMFITQFELRYLLNRINRIYLFSDIAIQSELSSIPISFGFGIQQKTPLGILRLDYAMSRDDTPSEGKIHIRLIGEF
ncbi:MAG: BamA/TamA family outer membrane protein [Candidatus Marinimicrobia bacterium]|nr:BamA/TamA family outer membrane protein [Candidatus Neomarinimicrobiota bacterium]